MKTVPRLSFPVLSPDKGLEDATTAEVVGGSNAATVHDELERFKAGGYVPLTPDEKRQSRALNRKLDLFVLPLCVLIYLLNGLDRSNLGNAQTAGFTTDLRIPADTINTASSLFFCTVSGGSMMHGFLEAEWGW